jgi:hypothetical protein
MAAALALMDFASKDAESNYLINHIAASDTSISGQSRPANRVDL